MGAKYCDEYVCLSVRWHVAKLHQFVCMLPVAVARSSILWRLCAAIRHVGLGPTYGFVDEVMLSYNGLCISASTVSGSN